MSPKTGGLVLVLKTRISSRSSVGRLEDLDVPKRFQEPGYYIYPPLPNKVASLIEDVLDHGVGFLLYRQIGREFALKILPKNIQAP